MITVTLTPAQNFWLEATWTEVDGETRTDLKHVSYHPTQLDLLHADAEFMGTPLDEHSNTIAEWVADYVPPPPKPALIPQSVTMRQARLALLAAGLLSTVETAIGGAGPAAAIEWDYATEVQRASGLVPAMATALGLTEAQIDALFVQAATL